MAGHCGTCTACCKVFSIPEFKKPAGPWCGHCAVGEGCKIYDQRPKRCVDFTCLWLESQGREDPRERFAPELRPDRCRVVFAPTTNPRILSATIMRAGAHRQPLVKALIDTAVRGGMGVAVGKPGGMTTILITAAGEKEVQMTEPDEDGMQYNAERA